MSIKKYLTFHVALTRQRRKKMELKVTNCARCGKDHVVEFKEFSKNPFNACNHVFTLLGMCPNLENQYLCTL